MKLQPHFLRIATLPIASLLFILAVAAVRPASASTWQGSEAEQYVLEELGVGELPDLEAKFPKNKFPPSKRELSALFMAWLLTSRDAQLQILPHGIWIRSAVITGELNLTNQEIPYDVLLGGCAFDDYVDLTGSHFAKGLDFSGSTFMDADFSGATIGFDFIAEGCTFELSGAMFRGMRVSRDFRIGHSTFGTRETSFESARVGGRFAADDSTFRSGNISFDDMRVDGSFSAQHCTFTYDQGSFQEARSPDDGRGSRVSFIGAHFADVFLNDSSFDKISIIDFTRMQADFISFDGVKSMTPSEVKLQRMTFKILSPVNAGQLEFLLLPYNAEFYTDLETSWRTHGYADEADKIYIAKRRAERRENCKSFLHQCDRGAWAFSLFQDALAGYGRHLENLLYWSLGFLLIGTFVFRTEKGMRIKDDKDAPHHAGRYKAFWYSLDLFLPIIKLGEADVWTPKDDRHWANLYRRVHIIIGSLFVPIGLAAWTGIIK